ncbi:MAG: hypothetical protein M1819_003178 [Sarea resinae]|nr:MAG: hypothetical protein M1819_003178 [Sarea resinae]
MALVLTVAAKVNAAALIPTLLAATLVNQNGTGRDIAIVFEDADSVGSGENYLQLTLESGSLVYDQATFEHLREILSQFQAGNTQQVTEWITRSHDLSALDFKALERPFAELDAHLVLRSYIVGYSLTLADLAAWGVIRGNKVLMATIRKKTGNVRRWFELIEATNPWISEVVNDLNAPAQRRRAADSATGASYNIGLENLENGIVTRFPPEPSGFLHIGHAKAALLNDYFAHDHATGTLICRFDDTNPSKEAVEFQDAIKDDLSLLGIIPDKTTFSSDYFQLMYELCQKLISSGHAYADDTDKATMNDERGDGIASKHRSMGLEETLARLEEMKSGSAEGFRWCIRARISVDDPNKAMRDPVMYRCNLKPHHRTGSTWKIYPTYDFCAPVLDSVEGVTHALRTNEYRDRNAQYAWVQNALGLRQVTIWDFARMNFIRAVWGWDDPRMPTIRGIRRRGMTIPALREFILKQGPSRYIVNLDWTLFWATNKKYIDPIAPRFTAVNKEDMVSATVHGAGGVQVATKLRHSKNPSLGSKKVAYSEKVILDQQDARAFKLDEEITLMNWGNAFVRQIAQDPQTKRVSSLELELHLAGDVKKTEKKITWLSKEGQDLVSVDLVDFDYLITKDKIEKGEDLLAFLTSKTEFHTQAWADCNLASLAENEIIQFERKGYFRVDRPFGKDEGESAVLFCIPTGKKV